MWRKLSVATLLFLLASLTLVTPGSAGTKEKVHQRVMGFKGIVQIDEDLQVLVLGTVGPPEFFENLRSVESPQGTTFLNDSGEVRFFPERMMITLCIIGPVTSEGRSIPSRKLNHGQMRDLRFKLQWKRGMKLRPVREFRMRTPSESSFTDLEDFGRMIDGWTYEMALDDSQVPITDHLVLYILSPENKLIARMSAYL